VTAALSATSALLLAVIAGIAARLQRRWGTADAFLRIYDQFESPLFREHRRLIYELDRAGYGQWSPDDRAAVDAWCAHLDLVATLVQAGQLDLLSVLNMYGDVMLRTIYQVAPYCNSQGRTRGRQFLLPMRLLTTDLVTLWRKRASKHRFPLTIGFPSQEIKVNPGLFDSDDEILEFRRITPPPGRRSDQR
jgi:hypothetical protein